MMIYTVTLNPSLDYIMHVPHLQVGATNRSEQEHIHIGGKGINVSLVLGNLGIPSTLLGFVGGFTGQYLTETVGKYPGLVANFLQIAGDTRINTKIKGAVETEINGAGPSVSATDIAALQTILDTLTSADCVILAGSMVKMDPQWYLTIAAKLATKKVPFIVDISSDILLEILQYKPLLVKPNLAELEAIFNTKIQSQEELSAYAKTLVERGAQHALISLGKDGSILASNKGLYQATVPAGQLIDSVGAGDSMVAGFVYGYIAENLPLIEAYRYASSCGTASAYSQHLATRPLIEILYQQTEIKEL